MTIKRGTKKTEIDALIKKLRSKKKKSGIDARKYCGVIKLKETPMAIQKRMRSEWD